MWSYPLYVPLPAEQVRTGDHQVQALGALLLRKSQHAATSVEPERMLSLDLPTLPVPVHAESMLVPLRGAVRHESLKEI